MHDRISVNQLCFIGSTLPQFAEQCRELGAKRTSYISPALIGQDLAPLKGLRGETIAHIFLQGPLSRDETTWQAPRKKLSQVIDIARQIGAKSIYMLTGGHGALSWEEAADCFTAAIAPCVKEAKTAGVTLAIENALPLYADWHIAHCLRDTVALAEKANVGICVDLFGCWTEGGLRDTLVSAMPRCEVIQVSDYVYGDRSLPSRAVPGDGAIPLERLLGWAVRAGFKGAFDLELIGPRIDKEGHASATRRTIAHLEPILERLGA
jgi:sugar phosphate isomerase/epimerase